MLLLCCLLLFGLVYWTFLPSLDGKFIDIDDGVFVIRNPRLDLSWSNFAWVFSHTECANWIPLTMCSFMLDHQFYGFDPWGYHLTNVVLHAVNTVLVFGVLRELTGATWRSLLVAALFGLHPLRTESVAWVSERKDVLSMIFWLLTLWTYAQFARGAAKDPPPAESHTATPLRFSSPVTTSPSLFYLLALLLFALALMSKPIVVTLPFVLLLLDYWPLERWQRHRLPRLLAEKIPFFLLSAVVIAATYSGQKNAGLMDPDFTGLSLSFDARLENAIVSCARYLGKLFWPANLCALYPYPDRWPLSAVFLAGALVLGVSFSFFALRHRQPYLLVGWLWFLGTLVPVLGLVSVGVQAMADRYVYIPSVGILIALVWGISRMTLRWPALRVALGVAGGLMAVICIGLTRRQLTYWKDDVSVWQRAVAVTQRNFEAHNRLGSAYFSPGHYAAAASEFLTTTELNPSFAQAWLNAGRALAAQNHMDEAIAACQKALAIQPRSVAAHNTVSIFLLIGGRSDEALLHCAMAVEIDPRSVRSQNNLGAALVENGRLEEALVHFEKALAVDPGSAQTHFNLGATLLRAGRLDDAIDHLRSALRLEPHNADASNGLVIALQSMSNSAAASTHSSQP